MTAVLAQAAAAGLIVALAEFAISRHGVDGAPLAQVEWLARLVLHWMLAAVPFAIAFARLDARAGDRGAPWAAYAIAVVAVVAIIAPILALAAPALLGPAEGHLLGEYPGYADTLRFLAWQLAFWGALGAILHRLDASARRSARALRDAELGRSVRERRLGHARLRAACARAVPGFLLVALQRIESLYGHDAPTADRAITSLVGYLRLALAQGREPSASLAAEARLVRAWLDASGDETASIAVAADAARATIEPGLVVPSLHRLRSTLDDARATEVTVSLDGGRAMFTMRVIAQPGAGAHGELAALERELAAGNQALALAADRTDDVRWTLSVALPARG